MTTIPFLHKAKVHRCGSPLPIHLQHCPVCDGRGQVKVWRLTRRSVAMVIDCPQCTDATQLGELLERTGK